MSESETVIGKHENTVRCIEAAPEVNAMVTGGWDNAIKIWDYRVPVNVGTYSQPGKVYTIAVSDETLVVGTSGRKVLIWDLRKHELCAAEKRIIAKISNKND